MDFAYTHAKKLQAVNIVIEFLNLAQNYYRRVIHYFQTNGETLLDSRFKKLTAVRRIITEHLVLVILA
jgi:uncharacterized membrane protein YjdF